MESYGFYLLAKPVQVASLNYTPKVRDQDLAEAIAKRRLGLLHQVGGGNGGKFLQGGNDSTDFYGFFRFKRKRVVAYKSPTWQEKNIWYSKYILPPGKLMKSLPPINYQNQNNSMNETLDDT